MANVSGTTLGNTYVSDLTPYFAGAGIGVLSCVVFAVVNAPLGITTALSQISGGAAIPIIGADAVAENSYWAKNPLALDYGTLFLAGTLLGAFAAAMTFGQFCLEVVPKVWRDRFGGSAAPRFAAAFIGGAIAMYGARLAGGCTSGHGISGGLQLAVSSWLFLAVLFAVGIPTAALIYPNRAK